MNQQFVSEIATVNPTAVADPFAPLVNTPSPVTAAMAPVPLANTTNPTPVHERKAMLLLVEDLDDQLNQEEDADDLVYEDAFQEAPLSPRDASPDSLQQQQQQQHLKKKKGGGVGRRKPKIVILSKSQSPAPPAPSSSIEVPITEGTRVFENEAEYQKYLRRRAKNNEAASKCRERKKAADTNNVQKVQQLEEENARLKEHLHSLRIEVASLKGVIDSFLASKS